MYNHNKLEYGRFFKASNNVVSAQDRERTDLIRLCFTQTASHKELVMEGKIDLAQKTSMIVNMRWSNNLQDILQSNMAWMLALIDL
jgi:hypothetical protein